MDAAKTRLDLAAKLNYNMNMPSADDFVKSQASKRDPALYDTKDWDTMAETIYYTEITKADV